MTHVLTIAARELRERNRIFIAAVAFAILPFLGTLLPGARAMGRGSMVALVGGLLAVAMGLGVAVALGASVVGRELSERRLSFLFSKPVSPAAIWFGKTIASLVAALASFAIILVPSLLVGTEVWQRTWTVQPMPLALFTVASAVVLFFIAHVASTMIRSRSALLALDVLALAATIYAFYLLSRPLLVGMAVELMGWMAVAVGAALLVVLAVTPVWQLDRGRTDRVRSHRALSRYLWAGVALVVLVTAAVVGWVVSASPDDLLPGQTGIEQSPDGRTTILIGRASHRLDYHKAFVVDETGKARRFDAPPWWSVEFARKADAVAWRSFGNRIGQPDHGEVLVRRGTGETAETGLRVSSKGSFVLSDDGSRVAVVEGQNVSVHDLARNELLASARVLRAGASSEFFFMTPDLLRVIERVGPRHENVPSKLRIVDFDIRQRATRIVAELDAVVRSVGSSPDGRTLFIRGEGLIVDAQSGAVVRKVTSPTNWGPWGVLLDDGTAVMRRKSGAAVALQISRPDGTVTDVAVPNAASASLVGQVGPGQLLVSIYRSLKGEPSRTGSRRAIAILDVRRGTLTNVTEDLMIAGWFWSNDPRLQVLNPERVAAVDKDGKPVVVNVLTGERKPLVRG